MTLDERERGVEDGKDRGLKRGPRRRSAGWVEKYAITYVLSVVKRYIPFPKHSH